MICALLQILHIEEGALPFLARLLPLYAREVRGLTCIEGGGAAYHRDCLRRLGLEVDQPTEQLDIGPDAQVRLAKGRKRGQRHHRIRPDVVRLQMEMVQELAHEAAGGQRKPPGEMVVEDYHLPRLRSGMRSLPVGRQPTRSAGGSTRPWRSSTICLSFTQEPSQDPFGKAGGSTSLPEAAPFPLGRDALGAIRVRIWMSGMVAERTRNPNPVGTKLGRGGF
jgi:hypothetical protein